MPSFKRLIGLPLLLLSLNDVRVALNVPPYDVASMQALQGNPDDIGKY